jgi:hypothetical protein
MSTAVLAMPIVDEQMPQFIDSDAVPLDAVRWLFFPGDALAPRRKRELKDLTGFGVHARGGEPFRLYSNGGDEINSPCLLRTKGVLPRALITPLEVAAVWTPPDLIPEGMPTFRGVSTPGAKWTDTLPGIKTFPGQVIGAILTAARNDQGNSKGVVEIESLRTVTWEDVTAERLQYLFFPTWPQLPPTLRELAESVEAGRRKTGQRDLQLIGDEMLSACEQFRLWATDRIKFEETLVAVGTTKDGWTHRLSDVGEQLMAQLEITAQSKALLEATQLQGQLNKSISDMIATQASKSDVPVVDVLQKLQENQNLLADALTSLVDRLTTPSAPTATAEPSKVPNKNKQG